jgi:hypothetical protein
VAIPTTVDPSARNDIELGSVTNWPAVYAAAGVAAFLVVGLAAVSVIARTKAPPAPMAAEPVAEFRLAPPPRPADASSRAVPPAPAAKSSADLPLWKPLVPPPKLASFPVLKPIIERPDLISVAIPNPPRIAVPVDVIQEHQALFSNDLQTDVREIDLDAEEGTSLRLLENADQRSAFPSARAVAAELKKTPSPGHEESVLNLIAHRTDLAGLPVRGESECRASPEAAKTLQQVSNLVRRAQVRANRVNRDNPGAALTNGTASHERDLSLVKALADRKEWLKDEYSAGLAQMLCVETTPVRLQLTKMLGATKGRNASIALARQSLFDLNSEVRQAAVEALTARPREEYRLTLVYGLRYPLPAVADRAATTLVAVEDRGAVSFLEKLLDLPNPTAPTVNEKKKWTVAEVVKVNHLRNCVLCHAPSNGEDNPVPGFVPERGKEIPVTYYAQPEGSFVRADVTYLKQDFSLMEEMADPGKWPARQRFDYLIRQRELTDQEIIDMADGAADPAKSYLQREAVRRALDKLTASDSGSSGLSRGK